MHSHKNENIKGELPGYIKDMSGSKDEVPGLLPTTEEGIVEEKTEILPDSPVIVEEKEILPLPPTPDREITEEVIQETETQAIRYLLPVWLDLHSKIENLEQVGREAGIDFSALTRKQFGGQAGSSQQRPQVFEAVKQQRFGSNKTPVKTIDTVTNIVYGSKNQAGKAVGLSMGWFIDSKIYYRVCKEIPGRLVDA